MSRLTPVRHWFIGLLLVLIVLSHCNRSGATSCLLHSCLCRSKGVFWTCDAACKANKQQFERRRKVFNDLNKDYLKGVAEVCM